MDGVKKTQASGSAFRPGREADQMRRLAERHHGLLPFDTVESIWRVIVSTFTYVQAPYTVHADCSIGDEKMRKQLWAQAYIDYRAAVDVAPDRAEAHYRLGYVFASLQHYGSAVREFKRGVFLDPTLPQTGAKLVTVFGPNSQIMRTSLMHKVADWLREDIRDPDRLFLLAVLLHFEEDARAREVFEAAQRMASLVERSVDHIVPYLSLPVEQPESAGPKPAPGEIDLPPLPKPQPAAVGVGRTPTERDDLPPAPVPDESTPTLPALSGVATPPTVDAVP